MEKQIKIENSSRLSYRLLGKEDAQILWQLDQDPEVMKFINGGKPNSMETINDVFIPRMLAYLNAEQGWGIWQVCDKNTQEYFGWVLVRPMDFFTDTPKLDDIELGWRFFQKSWGKGYATEAAIAIKNAIASQTNIHHVSALAYEDNIGSIGVMKKLGMEFIKRYEHKDPIGDFMAVHYQMSVK
ncbi:MAG: GNAT family N-acetyltransferase [Colwellia sp.]|nr:GNAT family N-acetyltransferase [Colwellia sp.]MCW9082906.1 GNAT family N-acetyltransferase [Colwellia sp.]